MNPDLTLTARSRRDWMASPVGLLILLAAAALCGWIGSVVTLPQIPTWYAGLAKPAFTPPNWLFGPAWTLLYGLMSAAAWLVCRGTPPGGRRQRALAWHGAQLALNCLWPILFFGLHWLALASVQIVLLWAAIAATALVFGRIRPAAGWLMLPYLAWTSYATALSWSVWLGNS